MIAVLLEVGGGVCLIPTCTYKTELLRNEMHHRGFLKFLLSSVRQLVVGKYDTSSICSPRMIREIIPGFFSFLVRRFGSLKFSVGRT